MNAAEAVRQWRLARHLTQAAAAKRLGVSERTWQRYEADKARPPKWVLKRIGLPATLVRRMRCD